MKLDVAAAKLTAAVRRDGLPVRELTVGVAEYLEGAEVLFPHAGNSLIAARGQDDGTAGGHDADLMGIDSGVERRSLADFRADRAVGVQAMHGDAARLVEGGKHILAPRSTVMWIGRWRKRTASPSGSSAPDESTSKAFR